MKNIDILMSVSLRSSLEVLSCSFFWNIFLCLFILFDFLWLVVSKKLPIPVLKLYPYVGASLCSLNVPSDFGRRDGSVESMSCVLTLCAGSCQLGGT